MGILEARKDAEKVGFPIVGEEKKDPSNVVDYDIHEEITKDASAVINSNNDTTTGMATVIPGINAPKLIAETSIIGDLGGGGIKLKATAQASFSHDFGSSGTFNTYLKIFTITDEEGKEKLKQTDDGLEIPSDGVYMLDIQYKWIVGEMDCTDNLQVNGDTVNSFAGSWSEYGYDDPTQQLFLSLNKGDIIRIYSQTRHKTSSSFTFNHYVIIKFNKIN